MRGSKPGAQGILLQWLLAFHLAPALCYTLTIPLIQLERICSVLCIPVKRIVHPYLLAQSQKHGFHFFICEFSKPIDVQVV